MIEFLQERERTTGCTYKATTNNVGAFTKLFVVLEGGTGEWARCGDDNVLLFDPTWGCNRYNLKLACFTAVDKSSHTVILAIAIISY